VTKSVVVSHLASSTDTLLAAVWDVQTGLLSGITKALARPGVALDSRRHPGDHGLARSGREALLIAASLRRGRGRFSSEQLHLQDAFTRSMLPPAFTEFHCKFLQDTDFIANHACFPATRTARVADLNTFGGADMAAGLGRRKGRRRQESYTREQRKCREK